MGAVGRPEYLRQQAELSLRRLRLDRIDLYQLHRIDPLVPTARTSSAAHLQENAEAAQLELATEQFDRLNRLG